MKKLLFAVSALAALALLAPSTGFAQAYVYSNQVGLYTTADGLGDPDMITGTPDVGSAVFVYLVLTMPDNSDSGNDPYANINAFECTVEFDPVPNNNFFKLNEALPPSSINVGQRADINGGFLDYIVGIDLLSPLPVVNEAVTLITFTFMNMSPTGFNVFLTPTPKPGIDGEMAFQSVQGDLRIMHPSSGDHTDPAFSFIGNAVPVEDSSFGSVKALFR